MAAKYTPPRLKEKPQPSAHRLYKLDNKCIRKIARSYTPKLPGSEALRRAIRFFHNHLYPEKPVIVETGE